jgi:hypothetical protein
MDWGTVVPIIITAIIAAIPGTIIALIALKKTPVENEKAQADTKKSKAETDKLHAEIADMWAEQVEELIKKVKAQELQGQCDRSEITALRLDIQQVRRENEQYRLELRERDEIIADLQRWAEQLVGQLKIHAPQVVPVQYARFRRVDDRPYGGA